ncbi:arginine-hydroxylase NDUFAF5, mitochondrial-like [Ylistrum balloti]|uniref:arginine-hydroxylase NDUFAF5, mitochondrial-like n=1 Tax=Ylistrum balloti TaxID=509963 RepID=UPI0029058A50|nr:arginine-hydroxylase NDUFAF5, mitochondrial-like [Ylistrum balloti]
MTTAPLLRRSWSIYASLRCKVPSTRRSHLVSSSRWMSADRQENIMTVFDRKAKRIQKDRTTILPDYEVYDYMKEEVGYRTFDRMCDIKREFKLAIDLGCGRGYVSRHILADMVENLYMCDSSEMLLEQAQVSPEVPTTKMVVDEESLPFKHNSADIVFSSLSLHWVNDLPGCFKQVHRTLKNDGVFLGCMYGGDTVFELRVALQLAEIEREGGFSPHISPFTSAHDLGNLLNRAGFTMLTLDTDEFTIKYPSMFELMFDLKGMGENNCSWSRRPSLHRDTMQAAAAIYKDMYGDEEGVPATFQVLNFIGWKPDPSQPQPVERGSQDFSFKDLDRLNELTKDIEKLKGDAKVTEDNKDDKKS